MNAARLGANLATLANALLGAGSIAYSIAGNKLWAMFLVTSAIAFDGLDGLLSRRARTPNGSFGRVADSVADAFSFGAAPAVLLTVHTDWVALWSPWESLSILVGGLLLGLALARLWYFTARGYRQPHFRGASTPQNALLVVLLVLLLDVPGYLGHSPGLVLGIAAAGSVLMVLPIPFPKIRRGEPLRLPMMLTSVAAALALVPIQFRPAAGTFAYSVSEWATGLFVLGMGAYYIAGPLGVHRSRGTAPEEEPGVVRPSDP